MRIRMLGTGTSHGVPMIGCTCAVCRSADPRDRRWRPSILVETPDGTPILVDTSTDLRTQALAFDVTRVDAILYTHSHADHLMGLDEVRRFNVLQKRAMPCYGDAQTLADIRRTFAYVFESGSAGGGIPQIELHEIRGPFGLGGVTIVPVPLLHGRRPIYGYRIGPFAYLTDCNAMPDASWPLLEGVSHLVLDALRDRPHPTHFTVAQALEVVARLAPARTWFTHICHELPHQATNDRLPAGVELAYDGLAIEVPLAG
ncbi:MAG: MBL fold metallo-hydrolase [Acidobacteriota bacterium]|nr:MBL fold metallo-hydrolase [Acidobacteriota bacterium]